MDVEGGAFDAEKEAQPVTLWIANSDGGLHFPEPWITVCFLFSTTLYFLYHILISYHSGVLVQ
jgi:hypothetical protein